jgi:hypothetical protein
MKPWYSYNRFSCDGQERRERFLGKNLLRVECGYARFWILEEFII